MRANHLTNGQSYLEIAIDAQHGGFPSRLLDVTYNCLVALYFAVTPFYTEKEASGDGEDGMVYVFFLEDLYCPTGNNINQAYNACIDHGTGWFSGQELLQKNHKLIDHNIKGLIKDEAGEWKATYNGLIQDFATGAEEQMGEYPGYKVKICRGELQL